MSFYATMEGYVICPTKKDFEALLTEMEEFGALVDDHIVDETGDMITEGKNVDRKRRELEIPRFTYRNMVRIEFFKGHPGRTGHMAWTSTDGCSVAGFCDPLNIFPYEFQLHELMEEDPPDGTESIEEWVEYMNEAENVFLEDMVPILLRWVRVAAFIPITGQILGSVAHFRKS